VSLLLGNLPFSVNFGLLLNLPPLYLLHIFTLGLHSMLALGNKSSSTKKKRPRAKPKADHKRRGWSTAEQDDFLLTYLTKHKLAQASRKFEAFWQEVDNAFNEKWPPEDVSERKKVFLMHVAADSHLSKSL
jgi:hypothetical protein